MAVYKVPQDVEAEDKLIGPFSFRQFIYLGIVAMSLGACWGLWLLFKPLAIIPLPIAIFFGALALPLRKDQPMETYLAAMVQFFLKPRNRMWMADGVVSRITIDIPIVAERRLTKDLTNDQALSQFDYLSQIADSGGWSSRGVLHAPMAVTENLNNPEDDIMDSANTISHNFDTRLERKDSERRDELLAKIHSGTLVDEVTMQTVPAPVQPTYAIPTPPPIVPRTADSYVVPAAAPYAPYVTDTTPAPVYSPAPSYMQQHVIQPMDASHRTPVTQPARIEQPASPAPENYAPEPSESLATPAIMELAKDVSVETIARQLHHEEVERHGDEIVINLH